MNIKQKELVEKFRQDLESINKQRRVWLLLSSAVFVSIIVVIFSWNYVSDSHLWWAVGSIGLIIAVNWWYWTMTLVRRLLCHQYNMVNVLEEISTDVKKIRLEFVPYTNEVDKEI